MNYQFLIPPLIFSTLALTACGGSSDGNSIGGTAGFTADAPMNLTTVNTDQAAAEGFGSTVSTSIGGAAKGTVNTQTTNKRIVNLISDLKRKTTLRNRLISSGPEKCANSGTQEFSFDDVTFAFTATYQNCSEYGEVTNGTITGTFSEGSVSTVFTMNASNFTIKSSSLNEAFSMSMNGTMVLTSTVFSGYDRNFINGTNMVVSMNYSGRSVTLGNFIMTYDDYFFASPSYDISAFEFDMNSAELGGSLHVASTQRVYQNYSDDYPYAGQIKMSGANNGSLLIDIIDATNIQLQTDANGDGIYEGNDFITWIELNNYLN